MIKVLVVDDSGFMRIVVSDIVNAHPDITVIDTAVNGKEAVEKTKSLNPDVVLLDLTMEDYDGMYAIKNIMKEHPVPIVILSSIRSSNPDAIIEALNAGAFDFLDKPIGIVNSKIRQIENEICLRIIEASKVDRKNLTKKNDRTNTNEHTFDSSLNYNIVVIGASTGGTGAIEQILLNLPQNFPLPIVIVQHMPHDFIQSFADRLNSISTFTIKVAKENEELKRGFVYLLPGHTNTIIKQETSNAKTRFGHTDRQFVEYNEPSIDCLFQSVAEVYANKSIGIILTGMGKDGTLGLSKIYQNGGYTIAQDEKSCIVYGMPRAAFESGMVKKVVPLADIPGFIVSALD